MFYESKHGIGSDYFTIERNCNFSFPLHMHRCYEIILILEGAMEVRIEKAAHTVQTGDMILILPNQLHSLEAGEGCRHILCIFSPELVAGVSDAFTKHSMTTPCIRQTKQAYRDLFLHASETDNPAAVKGLLYLLCGLFYDRIDFSAEAPCAGNTTLLHRIFRYIEENIDKSCSLREMAGKFRYDYSYLSRMFAENVGVSYNSYVRNVKINRACYLLRNTQERIADIAAKCGYASLCSFNRSFKTLVGKSPTEYREGPQP